MLCSMQKTQQEGLQHDNALRLCTPGIRDALCPTDAATYSAVAYAKQDFLKDFVLDPPRTGDKRQLA